MNVRDLLGVLEPVGARARPDIADVAITGVADDSRKVEPGHAFVAVPGMTVDGHDFIAQAAKNGAVVAVVERPTQTAIPEIVVDNAARALGLVAAALAKNPADKLTLIGITGTNGKTTTTYMVEAILAAAGARPAVLGTVGYRWGGQERPAPYTTPTPIVLHDTLAEILAAGCTHAILEVSSAALSMERMAGLAFDVAAFSNLTQDHLDLHGSMAAYQAAKERLFRDHLKASGCAAINVDDPAAQAMIQAAAPVRTLRVSATGDADITARTQSSTIAGIACALSTPRGRLDVESRALIGHYNVANIALAVAIAEALEVPHEAIAAGISAMAGVPGRVERVANDAGLDILVDYAHTPDALANVLDAVRPLCRRRLICVFGCGGDRDPGKRPKMGQAVSERADLAVVTSDNPRTEDPQAIIDMILPAVSNPFFVDADRRTAIRAAIFEATPGDIVVIAGKGHEDYQILGTEKIHFDDREQAAEACAARMTMPADALAAAGGGQLSGLAPGVVSRVVIDSRVVAPGDLYVAIRGETHDGHRFCEAAVEAGAVAILVDKEGTWPASLAERAAVIEVGDTRLAIGAIARAWQRAWRKTGDKIVIGVTGSAGKTTTKDLIAAALSPARRVKKSEGSHNNETGVPLTLLGLRPHHDAAVVEMGMRGLGQIAALAKIAEPDIGVIVNAGVAHVGILGSVDAIARGKGELYAHLCGPKIAVCPDGDERLRGYARAADRTITFGEGEAAEVALLRYAPAQSLASAIEIRAGEAQVSFDLPLLGRHNAINATCAMAAAIAAGLDPEIAAAGLARARPPAMRGEIESIAGRTVLVDCYNANPTALVSALDTVRERAQKAVAILGDMLELGESAAEAHREAGRAAAERAIHVVATGDFAQEMIAGAERAGGTAELARDPGHAAALCLAATEPGDWVLVKASRGARLERAVLAMRQAKVPATPEASH